MKTGVSIGRKPTLVSKKKVQTKGRAWTVEPKDVKRGTLIRVVYNHHVRRGFFWATAKRKPSFDDHFKVWVVEYYVPKDSTHRTDNGHYAIWGFGVAVWCSVFKRWEVEDTSTTGKRKGRV